MHDGGDTKEDYSSPDVIEAPGHADSEYVDPTKYYPSNHPVMLMVS